LKASALKNICKFYSVNWKNILQTWLGWLEKKKLQLTEQIMKIGLIFF
jgi:hypothetical protein